jgi:hypothetical protein
MPTSWKPAKYRENKIQKKQSWKHYFQHLLSGRVYWIVYFDQKTQWSKNTMIIINYSRTQYIGIQWLLFYHTMRLRSEYGRFYYIYIHIHIYPSWYSYSINDYLDRIAYDEPTLPWQPWIHGYGTGESRLLVSGANLGDIFSWLFHEMIEMIYIYIYK